MTRRDRSNTLARAHPGFRYHIIAAIATMDCGKSKALRSDTPTCGRSGTDQLGAQPMTVSSGPRAVPFALRDPTAVPHRNSIVCCRTAAFVIEKRTLLLTEIICHVCSGHGSMLLGGTSQCTKRCAQQSDVGVDIHFSPATFVKPPTTLPGTISLLCRTRAASLDPHVPRAEPPKIDTVGL